MSRNRTLASILVIIFATACRCGACPGHARHMARRAAHRVRRSEDQRRKGCNFTTMCPAGRAEGRQIVVMNRLCVWYFLMKYCRAGRPLLTAAYLASI
jgi:hypothetical protein